MCVPAMHRRNSLHYGKIDRERNISSRDYIGKKENSSLAPYKGFPVLKSRESIIGISTNSVSKPREG